MKTICLAFFALCFFSVANAQYTAAVTDNQKAMPPQAQFEDLSRQAAHYNALINQHNKLAQQHLTQYLAQNMVYPERLYSTQIEGQALVHVRLNPQGEVTDYKVIESPHRLFTDEIEKTMASTPAILTQGNAYVGARQLIIPIDFSLR